MRPLEFPLLTDENIAADVVVGLQARGCDVRTVHEERLIGRVDVEVLGRSAAQNRDVVTHDLAFGQQPPAAACQSFEIMFGLLRLLNGDPDRSPWPAC